MEPRRSGRKHRTTGGVQAMCSDAGSQGDSFRGRLKHDVELTCYRDPTVELNAGGFHDHGRGLGVVDHRMSVSVWSQVACGSWRRPVERGGLRCVFERPTGGAAAGITTLRRCGR
jgi:hypothetical protein